MTKIRVLSFACALVLAGACKKQESTKAGAPAGDTKVAPVGIANAAEYEAKANEFADKLFAVFAAAGTNCDKLAVDLGKLLDETKPTFDAAKVFETAHPDAKVALDKKMEGRMTEFQAKAGPALDACKGNKALADVLSKMPG